MKYQVNIEPDGEQFSASFPDIPEALTCDDTYEKTKEMAEDALLCVLGMYFELLRPVPMPSPIEEGKDFIEVPLIVEAKILLLNEFVKAKISKVELGKRLDITPPEVQRLLNVRKYTKIQTIARAFEVLGRRLELRLI